MKLMKRKCVNALNTLLAGIIVALGFGSCVSAKKAARQMAEKEAELDAARAEIGMLQGENLSLRDKIAQAESEIARLKAGSSQFKVVYGPPPTKLRDTPKK